MHITASIQQRFQDSHLPTAMMLAMLTAFILTILYAQPAQANAQYPTVAKQAYIIDFESGRVLLDKEATTAMKPASMAKIMTTYITFSRIKEGSLSLNDTFIVSEKAWKKGGSRSFLNPNSEVDVNTLLHGVIVQSGNDAAIVLAEGLAGSEEAFADEMNRTAALLGMKNTNFTNSTGWPDPALTTTAEDLAILSEALIRDFPADIYSELYPMFAKIEYTINEIKQGNRNPLLYGTSGADGLKTGYTDESGYGLVGSAERNGQRVVMVLNGMKSKKERASESRRLMELMFREFRRYEFYRAGEVVDTANVWLGQQAKVGLTVDQSVRRTLSRTERARTEISLHWTDPVPAPIQRGDQIGTLRLTTEGKVEEIPLIAQHPVGQLGLFDRVGEALKFLIFGAPIAE